MNITISRLPKNWPCQWSKGIIPFVFDFYALSPKRLISVVVKAHRYLEQRSCLVFQELNPVDAANEVNFTYLFYTYSEVLESCCLKFFTKPVGRRLVLITPICSIQIDVAHATLHALGLEHMKAEPFSEKKTFDVLFPYECVDMKQKMAVLEENTMF